MKTKVRIINSVAGRAEPRYDLSDFAFAPGEIADIHPTLAEAWQASGICEIISDSKSEDTSTKKKK